MAAATADVRQVAVSAPGRAVRRDIQGLRAVAVLLVIGFHAGVPGLGGGYIGVDVFFVISGFLITGLIVRELQRTGRLSLGRFYARRIRRLLPATAVTFVGVAVLTVVALPVTRWESIAGDIVASTAYVMNWRLADRSVDYLQAEAAASPLQHFWSLAVEEQFYIVWPLLIVALAWFARRRRGSGGHSALSTDRLTLGLLAIGLPSLGWSIVLTSSNPGPAYFVTTTRLWELVVGALLAVQVERAARAPLAVRAAAGWLGLAAIGWSAVVFTAETRFPGTAALVPTLGAAAVLWAGTGDGRGRLRLLEPDPMQDVGALSYSLYLWHWPLIVVATAVWGRDDGTLWLPTALVVAGFSAVPAWLTYRIVEQPLHHHPAFGVPWRAGVLGLVCLAIGLGSAAMVSRSVPESAPAAVDASDLLGAMALGDAPTSSPAGVPVDSVEGIVPSAVDAAEDKPPVREDECHQDQESSALKSCTYGDLEGERRVVLVGDSHAAQWQPALRRIAEDEGWRLEIATKSACLFADADVWLPAIEGPYTSCRDWGRNVVEWLRADPPDVVIVSTSGAYNAVEQGAELSREESAPLLTQGLTDMWTQIQSAGSTVVVLVDTPRADFDLPECIAEHPDTLTDCAYPRSDGVARSAAPIQRAAAERLDVDLVDLSDYICPREQCAPVIGGVMVMRDSNHLTATYAASLATPLERRLEGVAWP